MIRELKKSSGFTLVELMIVLAISGIIIGAIFSVYRTQQRTYLAQDQVAEMQQNLRAALSIMARDFRSAGYDPAFSDNFGILDATATRFQFTTDSNRNGSVDAGETLTYELYTPNGANITSLQRTAAGPSIADNIQAIEFCYDTVTTLSNNTIPCATDPPATQWDEIRSVTVSILARASKPDPNFTNTKTYTTVSGADWGPFNDTFRRRFVITTIKLRNMGLK